MKDLLFEPRLRADGTLDPTCLEGMAPEWLASWMRERLTGRDPYFPLDRRTDEDPEALIAGWVRSLGSGHPLSILLSRAARLLLEEARSAAPAVPGFLAPLLHLCQQVALPETTGWFLAELTVAAEHPQKLAARWPERRQRDEVFFAALRQAPGWFGAPARPAWQKLLSQSESTTFALSALGSSLEQQLPYLATWWRTCPPKERELELEQFVFEAWNTEGQSGVRELLRKARNLPPDLQAAIDRKLLSLGASPFFALTDAGPKIAATMVPERESLVFLRPSYDFLVARQLDPKTLAEFHEFTEPAQATIQRRVSEYTRKLIHASFTAKQNVDGDSVSEANVNEATYSLNRKETERLTKLAGIVGGIFLGTGLSVLVTVIRLGKFTLGLDSTILIAVSGILGAFLVAIDLLRGSQPSWRKRASATSSRVVKVKRRPAQVRPTEGVKDDPAELRASGKEKRL